MLVTPELAVAVEMPELPEAIDDAEDAVHPVQTGTASNVNDFGRRVLDSQSHISCTSSGCTC